MQITLFLDSRWKVYYIQYHWPCSEKISYSLEGVVSKRLKAGTEAERSL